MSHYKKFVVDYNNTHRFFLGYKVGEIVNGVQIVNYIGYRCENNGSHPIFYWRLRCLNCGSEFISDHVGNYNCPCQNNEYSNYISLSHTKIYDMWHAMKQRCSNTNSPEYHRYGGRGITVCPEWLDEKYGFNNFLNWALKNGYNPSNKYVSLERNNLDDNYCPENCLISTSRSQQCNNKSNNVEINWGGVRYSVTELCRHFGIDPQRVFYRMDIGRSLEESLFAPAWTAGWIGKREREDYIEKNGEFKRNPNAVNPFVSCKYPNMIDTNDPKLWYFSEDQVAAMRGISPVPQETEEEYQRAREIAKQNLINYLKNQ